MCIETGMKIMDVATEFMGIDVLGQVVIGRSAPRSP